MSKDTKVLLVATAVRLAVPVAIVAYANFRLKREVKKQAQELDREYRELCEK